MKARHVPSPYREVSAIALIKELKGDMNKPCETNKLYQCEAAPQLYYYVNSKGYYHICRIRRLILDGKVCRYDVVDDILQADGTIRKAYDTLYVSKDREDCVRFLNNEIPA